MPKRNQGDAGRDRAVALAGSLAERGLTRLVLESRGRSRVCRARDTDLPTLLLEMAAGGATVTVRDATGRIVAAFPPPRHSPPALGCDGD